jgi:hypothetical protein
MLNIFEALTFGLGISFLIFGYPLVRAISPASRGLTHAAHLSIAWLLLNWWIHDSLHIHVGMVLNGLLAIEYGFHVTLMLAGVILAIFYMTLLRQEKRPNVSFSENKLMNPPAPTTLSRLVTTSISITLSVIATGIALIENRPAEFGVRALASFAVSYMDGAQLCPHLCIGWWHKSLYYPTRGEIGEAGVAGIAIFGLSSGIYWANQSFWKSSILSFNTKP